MRAQVVLANRYGHTLDLGSETVRRKITHSARYGAISNVTVRCSRCGWMAPLTRWTWVPEATAAQLHEYLNRAHIRAHPEDGAFARQCPGEEYARDIASIMTLPVEREMED
jgi:hypothetical protein